MNIQERSHGFLCLKTEFRNANQENDHKPHIRCLTKRIKAREGAGTKKIMLEPGIFNVLIYAPTPMLISLYRRKIDFGRNFTRSVTTK